MSTVEHLLVELETLAAAEHSLIVEYLLVHSVLGHDSAPTSTSQAAVAAFGMATREMRHVKQLNEVLTLAGRPVHLGRSPSIDAGFVAAVAPGAPPVVDRLQSRERQLAAAVDARYERVRQAVAPGLVALDGPAHELLTFVLDTGPDHEGGLAALAAQLGAMSAAGVTLPETAGTADAATGALLDLSDHWYELVLDIVETWFTYETELGGHLQGRAIAAMQEFSAVNQLLVERGVLPRFTPPRI
jgi:hypothetical protein